MVVNGSQYCLYADATYMLRAHLQVAYPRAESKEEQRAYSALMSAMHEAVEWMYKYLKQIRSSKDFKRQLKIRRCLIALLCKSEGLLWNVKTRLHQGGQASSYFDCPPPSLERYMATSSCSTDLE